MTIAFKYHFVILLITLIRVQSASIRREPPRETVVDYVYEIHDDPMIPGGADAELAPGVDYDWKKYQEQELIFAPGSADELRIRPDGTASFTQPEVKRFHRTTGTGDDYYVYEYWYPAEEDLPSGLNKVLVTANKDWASGSLAEATEATEGLNKPKITPTPQPDRVKRANYDGTTSTLPPKPEVAESQQSESPTSTNRPTPIANAKLAVLIQSGKDSDSLNKAAGSSSDQEKSATSAPIISPEVPIKLTDESVPIDTVKQKKDVKAPAVLVERSSLEVSDATDAETYAKNTKSASKASPMEQTIIAAAPAAAFTAPGADGKTVQSTTTTASITTQTAIDASIPAASEVENKNLTKRHETMLTTSTEKPFEELDDLKTTTPKTVVVVRNTGNELVADVVPFPDTSDEKQVGTTRVEKQVMSEIAPAEAVEEVITSPPNPTTTTTVKVPAPAKEIRMAESQQNIPPIISSTVKSVVASVAPAEAPIFRFGIPEISKRETIAVNQAESQQNIPPIISSTTKSVVASVAPAEGPVLRSGIPEISMRETIAVNQAESQQNIPPIISSTVKSVVASAAPAEVPVLHSGVPEILKRETIAVNLEEDQVPVVITKRETGKPSLKQIVAAVTLVDGGDVEEAPANNIASEDSSTKAPSKELEKEDFIEEEEVEEPDQAPATKVTDSAASHVEEDGVEEAPTDQEPKDSLSKLVKKQTTSHGKHFTGDEIDIDEENMAPANKIVDDSGEEEEEATTAGSTGGAIASGKDVGEEGDEETKQITAFSENEDEEDDEIKDNVKREDSEATQEILDDSPKGMAEGTSLVKMKALSKRGDSGGGGAGIDGGGIAEGGEVNQSEGSKSRVVLTEMSSGNVAKPTPEDEKEEEEDDDKGNDSDDDDDRDEEEDDDEENKSESPAPAESLIPHYGKQHTGRRRRELSDEKKLQEENLGQARKLVYQLHHRSKRSSDMREVEVDGEKVYVDTPMEFIAPGSSFDGIADGGHLMMNEMPRRTRQTGSGYDAFPQNVGSDKFPHAFCDLERDTGIICPGVRRGVFLEQFYYDSETNRCSHFVYNGCGGNANRFSTLWECNQFCGKQQRTKRNDRQ